MSEQIVQQVVERLERLPNDAQQQVLDYVETLASQYQRGVPGWRMMQLAGLFDAADLAEIAQAIEADCERIDPDEW